MNCSLVEWQRILNLVCQGSDEGLVVKQLNVFFLGFFAPRTGKNSKTIGHRTRDHWKTFDQTLKCQKGA